MKEKKINVPVFLISNVHLKLTNNIYLNTFFPIHFFQKDFSGTYYLL